MSSRKQSKSKSSWIYNVIRQKWAEKKNMKPICRFKVFVWWWLLWHYLLHFLTVDPQHQILRWCVLLIARTRGKTTLNVPRCLLLYSLGCLPPPPPLSLSSYLDTESLSFIYNHLISRHTLSSSPSSTFQPFLTKKKLPHLNHFITFDSFPCYT